MSDLIKKTSLLVIIALALTSCSALSKLWKHFGSPKMDYIRGAALMDDSSLWFPEIKEPSLDAIEERDWAFTALGGMNAARLAVKMDYFLDSEGKPKESGFAFLDRQLAMAEKYGLKVILDMHAPPGGAIQDYRETAEALSFWMDDSLEDLFVKGWRGIAKRYAGDKRILAFELMNEPSGPPDDYWNLMGRTMAAIREIDPDHLIILQPDREWKVRKPADDHVAFSFHFYTPLEFTHQGVAHDPQFREISGVRYPGEAVGHDGKKALYDASALRADLSYPARVSRETGVPVIIGEFGISTAADEDSTTRWIRDVIDSAEEAGLGGYIYWREIDKGSSNISKPGSATMAVINNSCYRSPAQFFGIRPDFAKRNPDFDFATFYWNFEGKREKRDLDCDDILQRGKAYEEGGSAQAH